MQRPPAKGERVEACADAAGRRGKGFAKSAQARTGAGRCGAVGGGFGAASRRMGHARRRGAQPRAAWGHRRRRTRCSRGRAVDATATARRLGQPRPNHNWRRRMHAVWIRGGKRRARRRIAAAGGISCAWRRHAHRWAGMHPRGRGCIPAPASARWLAPSSRRAPLAVAATRFSRLPSRPPPPPSQSRRQANPRVLCRLSMRRRPSCSAPALRRTPAGHGCRCARRVRHDGSGGHGRKSRRSAPFARLLSLDGRRSRLSLSPLPQLWPLRDSLAVVVALLAGISVTVSWASVAPRPNGPVLENVVHATALAFDAVA